MSAKYSALFDPVTIQWPSGALQRSQRHLKTDWGKKTVYKPPCKWEKVANLKPNKAWYEKLHDRQNRQEIQRLYHGTQLSKWTIQRRPMGAEQWTQRRSFCISPPFPAIQPTTVHNLLPSSFSLGSRDATSFCPTENLNLWIPEPRFQVMGWEPMISNHIWRYLMMLWSFLGSNRTISPLCVLSIVMFTQAWLHKWSRELQMPQHKNQKRGRFLNHVQSPTWSVYGLWTSNN